MRRYFEKWHYITFAKIDGMIGLVWNGTVLYGNLYRTLPKDSLLAS